MEEYHKSVASIPTLYILVMKEICISNDQHDQHCL